MKDKNYLKKSFIMGIGTLILGFIPMLLLWIIHPKDSNLPGFFTFRAATWGDAIMLPLLMFSSTMLIGYNNSLTKKQKSISKFIGVISGVLAGLIQISWLKNPNIILNWTIPKVGYFNFAGWYHAIFFVGMGYFISLNVIRLFMTYYNNKKNFCSTVKTNSAGKRVWYYLLFESETS